MQRFKKGFTLIELLVVIAILALLMSVVMPALRKAKEASRFVMCKSNVRQIINAISLYAVSNDDRLIPGNNSFNHDILNGTTEPLPWQPALRPVNLGILLTENLLPLPTSNSHVFYCPSLTVAKYRLGSSGMWLAGVYESEKTLSVTDRRGFDDGWDTRSHIVNISYEFRDSIDGDPIQPQHSNIPESFGTLKLSKIGYKSLVSDFFSYGLGEVNHKHGPDHQYNYGRADGSADGFIDRGAIILPNFSSLPHHVADIFRASIDDELFFDDIIDKHAF